MVRGNKFHIPVLFLLLLVGCNKKTATVEGYVRYMNDTDNGLVQQKEIDAMVFEARYKTPELMALSEIKKTEIKPEEWESVLGEYQGLTYCVMTISAADDNHIYQFLRNEGVDEQRVEAYLNFEAQKDFCMVEGEDTAKCVLYTCSKTYGLAKQFSLALAFDDENIPEGRDKVLEFNAGFLGRGLLKFRYGKSDLSRIPKIIL